MMDVRQMRIIATCHYIDDDDDDGDDGDEN
jgi:hypothetical protein